VRVGGGGGGGGGFKLLLFFRDEGRLRKTYYIYYIYIHVVWPTEKGALFMAYNYCTLLCNTLLPAPIYCLQYCAINFPHYPLHPPLFIFIAIKYIEYWQYLVVRAKFRGGQRQQLTNAPRARVMCPELGLIRRRSRGSQAGGCVQQRRLLLVHFGTVSARVTSEAGVRLFAKGFCE